MNDPDIAAAERKVLELITRLAKNDTADAMLILSVALYDTAAVGKFGKLAGRLTPDERRQTLALIHKGIDILFKKL